MGDIKNKSGTIYLSEKELKKRFEFDSDSVLGEGGFAKVYKAYDKQFDEYVALKFHNVDNVSKYDIIREVKNSRKLSHKNIIRVHEAYIVKTEQNSLGNTEIQVGVLEYAEGGNLYDFLKTKPSEDVFIDICFGILDALEFLHNEKKLIHRDLSPDNILIFPEDNKIVPKLADFGISKHLRKKQEDEKKSTQLVGKVEYMAPEQFSAEKYGINKEVATNADLWTFGIILYELFLQKTPFVKEGKSNPMSIMHNICHQPLPREVNQIPEPYCSIIKKCLVKNAKYRIGKATEIKKMLNKSPKTGFPVKKIMVGISLTGIMLILSVLFMISETPLQLKMEEPDIMLNSAEKIENVHATETSVKPVEMLKSYLSDFTDPELPYEEKRSMIDSIIDRCFSGERASVNVLIDDITVDRRSIRKFLLNSLSRDVKEISIQSTEKDDNGKISNLSVNVSN